AQHRNGKDSTEPAQPLRFHEGVVSVILYIRNVNHDPFEQCPPNGRASIRYDGHSSDIIHEFVRIAEALGSKKYTVFLAGNGGLVGFAEPSRRFNERLQHALQIERRAANNLENIGGRRLL